MCILFIAKNKHPDYPLIICANRDEFHLRPTQKAHYWENNPSILAGKDLQAGGSWLGCSINGYFAAITNIREIEPSTNKRSRGELVKFALLGTTDNGEKFNLDWLQKHNDNYNGFNLIFGKLGQLGCYNNTNKKFTLLTDGFHAICNGSLDDIWPKMAIGMTKLETLINSNQHFNANDFIHKLQSMMLDKSQFSDHQLPQTGVPLEWERLLSTIFIQSDNYGTRSTSILLFDQNKNIELSEAQYNNEGKQVTEQFYSVRY